MFALPVSKPRFKSIVFFIKIALKLSYFCKKMQNFWALGAPPPDPHKQPLPLRISGYAPGRYPIFFYILGKKSRFNVFGSHFARVQSHLKELNF